MAYFNTATTTQNPIAASAASFLQNTVTRYKRYRLYRETYEGLNALTNRDLSDLGLYRSALRAVAWESVQNAEF